MGLKLLCLLLALPLTEEATTRGFPILAGEVEGFYLARAESGQELGYPWFTGYGKLVQGQVGVLPWASVVDGNLPSATVVIVQLLGPDRAIADLVCNYTVQEYRGSIAGGIPAIEAGSAAAIPVHVPKTAKVTFLLTGFDLSRVSDGMEYEIRKPLIVDGTHQYTTTNGGSNTIPIVRPTVLPKPPKHAVELGVGLRVWKDSTGKHEIEAAYVRYQSGEVELMKRNTETISVPISRLGKDEQEFVRAEIKKEREAEKIQQTRNQKGK